MNTAPPLAIAYRIIPEMNLVLVRFVGEVRPEEHIASFQLYAADPQFDGRQDVLLDLAEGTLNDSYFEEMQALAHQLKGYYAVRDPRSRTAIWAPEDVVYGMCRMYQSISEAIGSLPVAVFRTREEAAASLGFAAGTPATARLMAAWDAARAS